MRKRSVIEWPKIERGNFPSYSEWQTRGPLSPEAYKEKIRGALRVTPAPNFHLAAHIGAEALGEFEDADDFGLSIDTAVTAVRFNDKKISLLRLSGARAVQRSILSPRCNMV
jgi:hypothetical protein